jgi:uncharacterized protein YceK
MMKNILIVLALLASLLLAGCGPMYETTYSYQKPHTQRARDCIAHNCQYNKMMCEKNCSANNRSCEWQAHQNAQEEFRQYAIQQRENHQPINKSVSDFMDDFNCNNSCNCQGIYRRCYSTCGGTVIANTQCVAFCPKSKASAK